MFMTDKEKKICEALDGLIAPCDAGLNVDGDGYTLKTDTLEDLATAATFFRDAVDGKKNAPIPHIVIEVDTSKISELVREAQACIDRAVEDVNIVCADTDSIFACGLSGGMSTGKNISSFTDRSIKTPADVENYAINVMKKHNHFTDGGTPQKQVQDAVKIPEGKWIEFRAKLINAALKRCKLNYAMSCGWVSISTRTTCYMEYKGKRFTGTATRHPDDIENEYIGKSLSFNRAFDKLERAILGIEDEKVVGTALSMAFKDNYVNVRENGSITRCIAGADVDIGDAVYVDHGGRVYPTNSKQKGYRGGRTENSKTNTEKVVAGFDFATGEIVYMDTDSSLWKPKPKTKSKQVFTLGGNGCGPIICDFESTYGCAPDEMSDLAKRIKERCEDMSKKSDEMTSVSESGIFNPEPIHDDITITMTRKRAEKLLQTLEEKPGNAVVWMELKKKL